MILSNKLRNHCYGFGIEKRVSETSLCRDQICLQLKQMKDFRSEKLIFVLKFMAYLKLSSKKKGCWWVARHSIKLHWANTWNSNRTWGFCKTSLLFFYFTLLLDHKRLCMSRMTKIVIWVGFYNPKIVVHNRNKVIISDIHIIVSHLARVFVL